MCGKFYPGSPALFSISQKNRLWFKSQNYYLLLCDLSKLIYFTVSHFFQLQSMDKY